MILIADSGSTTTHWVFSSESGGCNSVVTAGINPFFSNYALVREELEKELLPQTGEQVDTIFFYGAGIVSIRSEEMIRRVLESLYPRAHIHINSDLLAAARATCGDAPGIVSILGTGSNSCLYNGAEIVELVSPLGFILGDEGSGAVLGKKLIADYLKNIMPEGLRKNFSKKFPVNLYDVLDKVYRSPNPNRYLAGFTTFLLEEKASSYVHTLLKRNFSEFVLRNLIHYTDYKRYKVHFVGSVAWYFCDSLKSVLSEYGLQCGQIEKNAIAGLINYHMK